MPCTVGTAKADLTDRQRGRWGDAEIKSSTRISEASDTLAWALWFSEGGSCLAVTHRVDTHSCQRGSNKSAQRPAPPARKKEKIYHLGDAETRSETSDLWRLLSAECISSAWWSLCVVQGLFVSLYPALPGDTLYSIKFHLNCSLKCLNTIYKPQIEPMAYSATMCQFSIRNAFPLSLKLHSRNYALWKQFFKKT